MEKICGNDFAEVIFSDDWKYYLSDYNIDTAPNSWFLKTTSQSFDALTKADKEILVLFLINPIQNRVTATTKQIPRAFELLFDNLIELYFQQKFSIVLIKEILVELIGKLRERINLFEADRNVEAILEDIIAVQQDEVIEYAQPTQQSLSTVNDLSIIDITTEGQKLHFDGDANNPISVSENDIGDEYGQEWKLGSRYGKRLQLTEEEIGWLNKFWDPSNAFIAVEQCCIETIKLYLACLKEINIYFNNRQSSLQEQVVKYTEGMVSQNKAALSDAYSINYFREQAEANIYLTIFKKAENTVRDIYRHKRKINDSFNYNELAMSFERRFGKMASEIIQHSSGTIASPDSGTELKLNKMNTARWKSYFDELVDGLNKEKVEQYATSIDNLAIANELNPSLEYIYYEACKVFTGINNLTALKFYLKYIYADLHSEEVNNKQLTKSIQKSLFGSLEQLQDFEIIVNNLIKTGNLPEALQSVEKIYAKRRKKLQLDLTTIEQIKSQHQNTVDRLNELLQEEDEIEVNTSDALNEEVEIKLDKPVAKTDMVAIDIVIIGLDLNDNQKELLLLFGKHDFQVEAELVSSYAKSRGLFKNALIERINDCCYDELDDVLIEETADGYEVNEFYYNKIINIC